MEEPLATEKKDEKEQGITEGEWCGCHKDTWVKMLNFAVGATMVITGLTNLFTLQISTGTEIVLYISFGVYQM